MSSDAVPDRGALWPALELFETGVRLMRQNLRREHATAPEDEIDRLLRAWLLRRPGAEAGDCPGRLITIPDSSA